MHYSADTGTWVFETPHWSRYAMDDSDDEDDVGEGKSSGGTATKLMPPPPPVRPAERIARASSTAPGGVGLSGSAAPGESGFNVTPQATTVCSWAKCVTAGLLKTTCPIISNDLIKVESGLPSPWRFLDSHSEVAFAVSVDYRCRGFTWCFGHYPLFLH